MKKLFGIIFGLLLSIMAIPTVSFAAFAAESAEPSYRYQLSVDGQEEKIVQTGDVITVLLKLQRTDADEPYTMYSMQAEIRYDSRFFEPVENSKLLASDIRSTDIVVDENYREVYMNFVSFTNTTTWSASTIIGSFQLRVIATEGSSQITNEDYSVSLQDGSGDYSCGTNSLTVKFAEEKEEDASETEDSNENFKYLLIALAVVAAVVLLLFVLNIILR